MQGSFDSLNQFKNKLFVFSFGLGLASTVAVFQPNTTIKEIGKSLIGFSIAGVVLGELITGKAFSFYNRDTAKFDEFIKLKVKENSEGIRNLDKITNELTTVKKESLRLKSELQQALDVIKSRDCDIAASREKIYQLETNLKEVGRFSTSEAHKIVRETYNRALRKLECHIEGLMRNYAPIADDFHAVLIEVDKFRNRFIKKLEEYDQLTAFNDLIDIGLDMQEKIIDSCIELRCKGQSIAIRYLNTLLDNSVSYPQYESDVINLQTHAGQTINQLKDELESQVRAIANDWITSNNQHVENYQTNFTELIEAGKEAVAKLQERDSLIAQLLEQIEGLQNELDQLRKPWQFPGTIDYAVAGNAIINFYHQAYGYVLDAIGWQETETGYTLTFAVGRNKTYLTADMLHDKDNQPQLAGLTNALVLPTFTPNYQSGLMALEVQTRKPAKKKTASETDINKLWIPASKFEATVKGWSRVRITGGSESGKSPTVENIAVCILKNRPGTAKLFNPQHDSVKNYWTIPTVGTSHKDSEKAIANLAKQVDARSNGQESRDSFELSIFDEIDSTMSHTKGKKSAIGGDVNFIIKQASHQNLGAIFIGQNANVSEYPGMDRSDWNSAINIHIGSNAYDALTNTNLLTTEETTRLKGIADKLTEFCHTKNDELGLDKTDPNSYRFALVMEPNKKPYFIELPSFGTFTYNDVINSCAISGDSADASVTNQLQTLEPLQNKDVISAKNSADSGYVGSSCPDCSSTNIQRNGKQNGKQRYRCKDCGKHFTSDVTNILDIGF